MLAPPSKDKKNQCQSGHILGPPPPPPSPPSPVVVKVDPSTVTHTKQPGLMGCHVDLGFARQQRGIYSQLLYGESFETFAAKRQQQGGQQQQQHHGQQRHESQPESPLTYWLPFDGHPMPTPAPPPPLTYGSTAPLNGKQYLTLPAEPGTAYVDKLPPHPLRFLPTREY